MDEKFKLASDLLTELNDKALKFAEKIKGSGYAVRISRTDLTGCSATLSADIYEENPKGEVRSLT